MPVESSIKDVSIRCAVSCRTALPLNGVARGRLEPAHLPLPHWSVQTHSATVAAMLFVIRRNQAPIVLTSHEGFRHLEQASNTAHAVHPAAASATISRAAVVSSTTSRIA